MKSIVNFFIALGAMASNKFLELRLRHRGRPGNLERAVRRAKRLHKRSGKRYRVFFILGKYRVWTREDIKRRKNSEILRRDMKVGVDFDRIAFFDTNTMMVNIKNTHFKVK